MLSSHRGETDDQQETEEKNQKTASPGGGSPSLSVLSANILHVLPLSLGFQCRVLESGTAMCLECSTGTGQLVNVQVVLCFGLVRVLCYSVYREWHGPYTGAVHTVYSSQS